MTPAERLAWLEERRTGLGSSDAPAVCGVNPPGWRTPLHVFADKLGLLPPDPPADDGPLYWGLRHEPVLAEEYERRTGRRLVPPDPPVTRHPDLPWLLATVDRLADDGRVVELKTSRDGRGWGRPGTDEVPDQYLVQVTHQMLATGRLGADLAVLVAGCEFRVYTVAFCPALADLVRRVEADFWDRHVTRRDPPPADWSHKDTPALAAALRAGPRTVDLGAVERWMARRYEELGELVRPLEREREALKAELFRALGSPGVGRLPGGGTVGWKVSRFTEKARPERPAERNLLTVTLEDES